MYTAAQDYLLDFTTGERWSASGAGQSVAAGRGGALAPYDMPATAREMVTSRFPLSPHGTAVVGRRNPHGERHTDTRIAVPAGRLQWARGVDDHWSYAYWDNAFHSQRARLGAASLSI